MKGIQDDPVEESDTVSVFLTCISCGKVEEVHVFRERGLPPKVYWDCLDCQRNGNRAGEKPDPR